MSRVIGKLRKRVLWKLIYLINFLEEVKIATWLSNTYITNTVQLSIKAPYVFLQFFLWLRITIIALVLQLIWYCSTSWVSNIGDLVLVLIFLFKIIKFQWFRILRIIGSNFLKIGNGWTEVKKYATYVVYVGTHFFPQFLENSKSHSNVCNTLYSSKKYAPIKSERDWWFYRKYDWHYRWSSEHQNYEKCECKVRIVINA